MGLRRRTIGLGFGSGVLALLLVASVLKFVHDWRDSSIFGWLKPAERADLEQLVSAVGGKGHLHGRLTGGFIWAPRPQTTRDDARSAPSPELDPDALAAAASIVARARERASAGTLAAAGTALLILGDIDAAVTTYESSVALDANVASTWSDLSAAYLERFHASGSAIDLLRSLEAVEKAQALSSRAEGLFNRAVVLEQLQLLDPAKTAWEDFLREDDQSEWAAEARRRLASLGDQSGQRDAAFRIQHERERLLDDVLARWATAEAGEGVRYLAEAHALARSLEAAERDRLASDVIAAIEAASRDASSLASVKAAHARYGEARSLYSNDRFKEADLHFLEAERQARGRSPLAVVVRMYRAIVRYRLGEDRAAEASLEGVLAHPNIQKYPSVRGRALWTLAVLSTNAADHYRTIERCDEAIEALLEAREYPNSAFVKVLRAAQQEYAGDLEGAWRARVDAFAFIDRESPFLNAAQSASRFGYPLSASVLYDRVASMGRRQGRDTMLADALRSQARALTKAGVVETGGRLLAEARALAAPHAEPGWDPIKAEIDLADSEGLVTSSPDAAVAAASRAVDFFSRHRRPRLPDALLARARAHQRGGDTAAAAADLERGIETIEELRSSLTEWRFRAQVGDVVQQFGEELFTLHLAANRPDEAFEAAERLRDWEVKRKTAAARTPTSLRSLAAALPAGTAMVWYFVRDEETVAWGIGRGSATLVRIPAGRARLAGLVRANSVTDRRAADALGSLLLGPFAALLEETSALVIVPDGPIHLVPFAALPGISKPYLVEERVIQVSVSASTYARSLGMPHARAAPQSALVVGNPALSDPGVRPLRSLREAAAEAAAVSGIYPHSTLLTGGDATREAVLRELSRHAVFHFAGHSIANNLIPGGSRLVIAGPEDHAMTAVDISAMSLDHLQLVMLSSCESVAGVSTRSEGPMGLARAFLSAGAHVVLASLAPVGDRSTRELATAFHREFQRSHDAAAALRQAQLGLLRSPDPALAAPEAWAYFVVIGASSIQE